MCFNFPFVIFPWANFHRDPPQEKDVSFQIRFLTLDPLSKTIRWDPNLTNSFNNPSHIQTSLVSQTLLSFTFLGQVSLNTPSPGFLLPLKAPCITGCEPNLYGSHLLEKSSWILEAASTRPVPTWAKKSVFSRTKILSARSEIGNLPLVPSFFPKPFSVLLGSHLISQWGGNSGSF